jgi:hypothetical protein
MVLLAILHKYEKRHSIGSVLRLIQYPVGMPPGQCYHRYWTQGGMNEMERLRCISNKKWHDLRHAVPRAGGIARCGEASLH